MKMIKDLMQEIENDEGCKHQIYKCTAGHLTFGIGHLVKPDDPEFGKDEGFTVSEKRVQEAFRQDVEIALADCKSVFRSFDDLPEEAQKIIANMMFQLGLPRFRGFKKLIIAINHKNWTTAAQEMQKSRWFWQTNARAKRLIKRMNALSQAQ